MIFLCSPKQSSFVHGKKKSLRATAHLWAIGGCVWKWIWADSEPMSKPKMPIANANGRCGAQEMTQVWGNYRNEQGQTAEMLQITIWKRRNARLDACIHRCRCRAREIHMFVQPENVRHTQAFASIYWQPHTRRTSVCVCECDCNDIGSDTRFEYYSPHDVMSKATITTKRFVFRLCLCT